jgi:hypothetical protein
MKTMIYVSLALNALVHVCGRQALAFTSQPE